MKYGRIPGIDKYISSLVMGTDHDWTMPYATLMFDDFFERGGNTFNTTFHYFEGRPERLLGQWIQSRSVRDQVLVIGKGDHTPNYNPELVTKQLQVTLERLQIAFLDIYFLHRDNLDIPVAEFVDILTEHHRAVRIKTFGGSNWTIQRITKANQYAEEHRLASFHTLSNNFSLSRMVNPAWEGVVASSDSEWITWLTQTQTLLFPWSSQARGFFTDRARPHKQNDELMVREWHSDDNFKRRHRVIDMAAKKGVEAINIALAYVLRQPFPTFPLIGPQSISETSNSCQALQIQLTPDKLAWLNREQ